MRTWVLYFLGVFCLFTQNVSALSFVTNADNNTVSVIDSAANRIIDTIAVGTNPTDLVVNSDSTKLYVTNSGSNTVSVIDISLWPFSVSATIEGFDTPDALAIASDDTYVAVMNNGNNTLVAIDTSDNSLGTPITVGVNAGPDFVVLTPDNQTAYTSNSKDATVSVVNMSNFKAPTIKDTIAVGQNPSFIAISPDGNLVLVSNKDSNSVSAIFTATNEVNATLSVGSEPKNIAFNDSGDQAYVLNIGDDSLTSLSIVNSVTIDHLILDIAITPDGTKLYMNAISSDHTSGAILIFDIASRSVIDSITGVHPPLSIEVTPDGAFAYLTAGVGNSSVYVIDTSTNTITKTISVGQESVNLTFSSDGNHAYVVNEGSDNISIIDTDTQTVSATIELPEGSEPIDIAVTPDESYAYVTNYSTGDIAVIDLSNNTIIAKIEGPDGGFGYAPWNIAITPDGDYVYASYVGSANAGTHNFSIIETATNTLAKRLRLASPNQIQITHTSNRAYVTGSGILTNQALQVIDTTTQEALDSVQVPAQSVAVAPNDEYIYASDGGYNLYILSSPSNIVMPIPSTSTTYPLPATPSDLSVSTSTTNGQTSSNISITYQDSDIVTSGSISDLDANTIYGFNSPTSILSTPNGLLPPTGGQNITFNNIESLWCIERFAHLTWSRFDNVQAYSIYRDNTLIATLSEDTLSFKDQNIRPDIRYQYILEVITTTGAVQRYSFSGI